ncbi:MAG: hypothetical protein KF901_16575 [Myxococcales bacterium]|nr:hypothetical protein [Myxococcales bacterium]
MSTDSERSIEGHSPHGFDDTPTRDKTIAIWATISALTLVGLIPFFHTYFNKMTDAEIDRKVQNLDRDGDGRADYLTARDRAFADARRQLTEAPTSIEAALGQLTSQGRNVPAVRPRRNDGVDVSVDDAVSTLAAVEGWTLRKHEDAREVAEAALLRGRADEVARRIVAAEARARAAGLEADADAGAALAERLRQSANAETVTEGERWLAVIQGRIAGADAPSE